MESKPKKQKIFSLAQGEKLNLSLGLYKTTEGQKKTSIKSAGYKGIFATACAICATACKTNKNNTLLAICKEKMVEVVNV